MKNTTTMGKANGSGQKPEPKSKAAEGRALERERRWRELSSGFRAIVSEMKRVTWPSREEWVSATAVVVGLVIVVALWTQVISVILRFIGLAK
ncbi:MAG TPA: preprotein translocase subunit SecE [Candidatus Acidoferrales bacterium]|nr:preprotein translocase subunit SecE [Candidatus Acidoferrales bacterium]